MYYINNDVNLKYGGRSISKISPEKFIEKSIEFINKNKIGNIFFNENNIYDVCNSLAFTI